MKPKYLLACVLMLFLCASASGAEKPPAPDDFAYAIPVDVGSDGAIYEITLPVDFYRGVTRPDLGDAAMFNSHGEITPFALRNPAAEAAAPSPTASLPIFPLQAEPNRKADALSLQIRRDSAGAIIAVNPDETTAEPERKIEAYLLDASALKQPIQALELEWDPAPDGFVGKVSIDVSDDLDHWSTLVKNATIASLHYGDHSLVQRRIALRNAHSRYLRIQWPQTREEVRLTAATARLMEEAPEQPRQWTTVGAAPKEDRPGEYYFDALGHMPFDRLQVRLPRKNMLVSIAIHSRPNEKTEWRLRSSETVYNLRIGGEDFASPDIVLAASTPDRFWMLKVERNSWGMGESAPELLLGWIPQQIIFVAQGEGPFRLAYGSGRAGAASLQNRDLLNRFAVRHKDRLVIEPARAGSPMILGGESKLRPPPPPIPWKQWVLWLTLLAGVLLLAWMAARLHKQMSIQDKDRN